MNTYMYLYMQQTTTPHHTTPHSLKHSQMSHITPRHIFLARFTAVLVKNADSVGWPLHPPASSSFFVLVLVLPPPLRRFTPRRPVVARGSSS